MLENSNVFEEMSQRDKIIQILRKQQNFPRLCATKNGTSTQQKVYRLQ
jgi:hypothetical protein